MNSQLQRASQLNPGTRYTGDKLTRALAEMNRTLADNGFREPSICYCALCASCVCAGTQISFTSTEPRSCPLAGLLQLQSISARRIRFSMNHAVFCVTPKCRMSS